MRGTVHLVSARRLRPLRRGARRRPAGLGDARGGADRRRRSPSPLREFRAEPRTRAEVLRLARARARGRRTTAATALWYAIRLRSRIAHSAESSRWRAPIHNPTFVAVEQDDQDGAAARAELVRRYLAAFGPATRAEIAGWSGMKVRPTSSSLLDGLARLRDDRGRELLDLPRAPLPAADTPAPVRFLPKFDNVLLDRRAGPARGLPQARRPQERRRAADVHRRRLRRRASGASRSGRVVTEPFAPLPRTASRELEDEAGRLAAWLG